MFRRGGLKGTARTPVLAKNRPTSGAHPLSLAFYVICFIIKVNMQYRSDERLVFNVDERSAVAVLPPTMNVAPARHLLPVLDVVQGALTRSVEELAQRG